MTPKGELIITGVQEADAGDYQCIATNEAGQSRASISLEVGCNEIYILLILPIFI